MPIVLLVEDKDTHQDWLSLSLRDWGYEVIVCPSVADTKREVGGLREPPSGVLLDLRIPRMAGTAADIECGRDCGLWLRNQPATKEVPIVVFSAYTDDQRVPGWCDVIGTSGMLKKHEDALREIERVIRANFR